MKHLFIIFIIIIILKILKFKMRTNFSTVVNFFAKIKAKRLPASCRECLLLLEQFLSICSVF